MPEEKTDEIQEESTNNTEEKSSEKEPVSEFIIENGILRKYSKQEESKEKKNAFSTLLSLLFSPKADSHIIIPEEVKIIGAGAFKNCRDIVSITFTGEITEIGHYAFSGCKNLTSIIIPDKVTAIGDYTFKGCDSLISMEIPPAVRKIGKGAFGNASLYID